jgi:divalent metal cation (Fe/Co/Zn/Cd) transporter
VVILGLLGVVAAKKLAVPWLAGADSVAAILVAGIVLVLGWKLGKRAVDVLLDRAPAGARAAVLAALSKIGGMDHRPWIRIRQAGDRVFADVELFLEPGLPIAEGERIADHARRMARDVLGEGSSVLVQLRASTADTASVRERVATAASMEGVHAHNITVRSGEGGLHADLHLEIAGGMSLSEGHGVADRVESTVLREVPELRRVDIHLDVHDEEPDRTVALEEGARTGLERRIRAVAAGAVPECKVHDLLLVRTDAGLYLSCHCTLPGGTSMRETHEKVDRLEKALYRDLPELDRVSVHAEPEKG